MPKIKGKIVLLSKDASLDNLSREFFYDLKISVNQQDCKNLVLISGMPVEIYILQNDRSILSYFYSPIIKSFKKSFNELF